MSNLIQYGDSSSNRYFLPSNCVKMFPSSYRGYSYDISGTDTQNFDINLEAQLATEFNFRHVAPSFANGTYIKEISNATDDNNDTTIFCFIGGYYFELNTGKNFNSEVKNKKLYITLVDTNLIANDSSSNHETTKTVRSWHETGKNNSTTTYDTTLDFPDSTAGKDLFSGILFTNSEPGESELGAESYCLDLANFGQNAIAFGAGSTASGENAIAFGEHTIASGSNQLVFGYYNSSDDQKIEIVGGGTSINPTNIRTLDAAGNEWLAGNEYLSGDTIEALDSANPTDNRVGFKFVPQEQEIDIAKIITSLGVDHYNATHYSSSIDFTIVFKPIFNLSLLSKDVADQIVEQLDRDNLYIKIKMTCQPVKLGDKPTYTCMFDLEKLSDLFKSAIESASGMVGFTSTIPDTGWPGAYLAGHETYEFIITDEQGMQVIEGKNKFEREFDIEILSTVIKPNGSIIPSEDNKYYLGTSSYKWQSINTNILKADEVEVSGEINKVTALKEDLKNGNITVKKANIAMYADNDTSKGTIEERLTRMGFSEGAVESLVSTASVNEIKKQGKVIYIKLRFAQLIDTDITGVLGVIPAEFRPTTQQEFYVGADWFFTERGSSDITFYGLMKCVINTNGQITLDKTDTTHISPANQRQYFNPTEIQYLNICHGYIKE